MGGRRHGRFYTRTLASSRQAGGKDAGRIRSLMIGTQFRNTLFMHGNVVEITKAIL
jgi:inorganic triphosphatase YgiF